MRSPPHDGPTHADHAHDAARSPDILARNQARQNALREQIRLEAQQRLDTLRANNPTMQAEHVVKEHEDAEANARLRQYATDIMTKKSRKLTLGEWSMRNMAEAMCKHVPERCPNGPIAYLVEAMPHMKTTPIQPYIRPVRTSCYWGKHVSSCTTR